MNRKKQRELRKAWQETQKRMAAMSLGGKRIKPSTPAPKKSVADPLLAVLSLNADRLASNVAGA